MREIRRCVPVISLSPYPLLLYSTSSYQLNCYFYIPFNILSLLYQYASFLKRQFFWGSFFGYAAFHGILRMLQSLLILTHDRGLLGMGQDQFFVIRVGWTKNKKKNPFNFETMIIFERVDRFQWLFFQKILKEWLINCVFQIPRYLRIHCRVALASKISCCFFLIPEATFWKLVFFFQQNFKDFS